MRYKLYGLFILLAATIQILVLFKSKPNSDDNCQKLLAAVNLKKLPQATSQLILVRSLNGTNVEIRSCQQKGEVWHDAIAPFSGIIGKNGIALVGEKKEGDMKTPAGLYPLGEAFGSQPLALKMDYKYITADDKFVDDVNSKRYNTWVHGITDAKSYEPMLIAPYKMGLVINYNMNPTIAGAGSAIFMHLWKSSNTPTAGCIAMDEQRLLTLLHWLDKTQQPHIYIATSDRSR